MASLKTCLGIHSAPPQVAAEIRKKMDEYKQSGYDPESAIKAALKDLQGTYKAELDDIHAQVKAQRPDLVKEAPGKSAAEQQIDDLMAAQIEIVNPKRDTPSPLGAINVANAKTPTTVVSILERALPQSIRDKFTDENGVSTLGKDLMEIQATVEQRYQFLGQRMGEGLKQLLDDFKVLGMEKYKVPTEAEWRSMSPDERIRELYKLELTRKLEDRKLQIQRKAESDAQLITNMAAMKDIKSNVPQFSNMRSLQAFLAGDARSSTDSLVGRMKGVVNEHMTPLYDALKPYENAIGFKLSAADEVNVLKEMTGVNTGDANAAHLAKAWKEVSENMLNRMSKRGIKVGKLENHIVRQSWNTYKALRFGMTNTEFYKSLATEGTAKTLAKTRQAWVDYMMRDNVLDRQNSRYVDPATGGYWGDDRMRNFLGAAWEKIAGRPVGDKAEAATPKAGGFAGRMEAERQLHFANAEAWHDANTLFGTGDLFESMIAQVNRSSRDIAILETMGPKPDAVFQAMKAEAIAKDGKDSMFYKKKSPMMDGLWMEITGSRPVEGYGFLSYLGGNVRSMLTTLKLPSALLSQPTDLAVFNAWAAKHNLGNVAGMFEFVKELNPRNAAHRAAADEMNYGVRHLYEDVQSASDGFTQGGVIGKVTAGSMKLSGMEYWTRTITTAAKLVLSRGLYNARETSFTNLEAGFKQMLRRNGIDAKTWDAIRKSTPMEYNGGDIIHPKGIEDRAVRETLASMIEMESHYAVVQPDELTRAFSRGTLAKGTLSYEASQSMMQFKTFTLAFFQRIMPMMLTKYRGEGQVQRYSKAAAFVAGMTILGAASTQLKQLRDAKEPKDMSDPKFWAQAAMTSVGASIFGDFFYGSESRFGTRLGSELAGPLASTVVQAGSTVARVKGHLEEGDTDKAAAEALKFLQFNSIPQYWWGKWALNHYLWYPMLDTVNPGYTSRMQSRQASDPDNPATYYPGWGPAR